MLYVLIGLVVALALISGFEYAELRVVRAERKAELADLKEANSILADKNWFLRHQNKELASQLKKLGNIEEGLN